MNIELLKKLILSNAIIEGLAGIIVLIQPAYLLYGSSTHIDLPVINIGKLYGIAAIGQALFSYIIFKYGENTSLIKFSVLILIGFHLAVGLHYYGTFQSLPDIHIGIFIVHLLIAFVFAFLYLKYS
ncbi:MAG TPA: hypothetical protein PKC30_02820 [Saprospiraceae bacterium]|nr:hypothetical protein [Saprospiraceae bacterium]